MAAQISVERKVAFSNIHFDIWVVNKVILLEISPTLNDEPMHKLGIVTMAFSDVPNDDKSDRYHMQIVENLFLFFRT